MTPTQSEERMTREKWKDAFVKGFRPDISSVAAKYKHKYITEAAWLEELARYAQHYSSKKDKEEAIDFLKTHEHPPTI